MIISSKAKCGVALRRQRLLAASALAGFGWLQTAQGINATWVAPADGTWTVPANWSTNPSFPNNGQPNAADTYDATIAANGAAYTVSLLNDITVNSLTLNSAGATVAQSGGSFRAINGLNLQAGTFQLLGSAGISHTIISGPGTLAIPQGQRGFLDAVTLDKDVTINSAYLYTYTGLTLNNRTLTMAGNATSATLVWNGTQTIGGAGTIAFDGPYDNNIAYSGSGGDLTIGPNITVRTGTGSGTVYFSYQTSGFNNGTLSAMTSGKVLTARGAGFTNTGTLEAKNGSTLSITADNWSNTGTIQALAGSTVSLGGTISVGGLGTLLSGGGTFQLAGTILNAGRTLSINVPLNVANGTLSGGTLATTGAGTISVDPLRYFSLDNVTVDTDLTINSSNLYTYTGLTLNNRTLTMAATATNAALIWNGTQTIGGVGTIVFDGAYDNKIAYSGSGGALTLGQNITLKTGTGSGTILFGYQSSGKNLGTISAMTSGKSITVRGDGFINSGTLEAKNGSTLSITAENWSNTGTIQALAGSTVSLGGTVNIGGLGTLLSGGGTFQLSGTILNAGRTLSISVPLSVNSGTISGGTLAATAGGTIFVDPSRYFYLDNVTLDTDLKLDSSNLFTYTGLSLNSRTLTLAADLTSASLIWNGTQTIGGTGTIVFDGPYNNNIAYSGAGGALTIGPNITVRTGTGSGTVYFAYQTSGFNNGTLSAMTSGKVLTARGAGFTNTGTLEAKNGSTLSITADNWSNTGTIQALAGSTVSLGGTVNIGGLGTLLSGGGTFQLSGTILNAGRTLSISVPLSVNSGTISGGTLAATAGGTIFVDPSRYFYLDNVTLDTDLKIDSSYLFTFNGLTLNNRTVTLSSNGPGASLIWNGTQTIGGTGSIVFDGPSSGAIAYNGAGGSLTIGPNITVRTGTGGGQIYFGYNGAVGRNLGTLSAATSGKTFQVLTDFTNSGTFEARNGGILSVASPVAGNATTLSGGHYYVYGGSTLTLSGSAITTNAADVRLDGANSRFSAMDGMTTNSGTFTVANGRAFNFVGPVTNTSTGAIIAASGGSIGINGGSNIGTIEAQSGGTLIFNGNFNHLAGSFLRGSGKVVFNGGIQDFFGTVVGDIDLNISGGQANFRAGSSTSVSLLNISVNNTILEAGAVLNVGTGGLNLTGNSSPAVALGSGVSGAKIMLASGNVSVSGNTTAQILTSGNGASDGILDFGATNRTFTIADGTADPDLLITATVNNGALTKSGAGRLMLTNSNSYTGGTTLSNGTISITDPKGLGSGSVVFSGGALDLRSDDLLTTYANVLSPVSGSASMPISTGRITSGAAGTFRVLAATLGSNLTVNGTGTLQMLGATLTNNLVVDGNSTVEIAGPLTGNFGITRSGATGTLILSGSSANTYTGSTTLSSGQLLLNKTAGNAIPHDLQILGGTLKLLQSNQINDAGAVNISGGTLDLNGMSERVAAFSGSAGGTVQVPQSSVFTVAGNYTYTGNVSLSGLLICDYTGASPAALIRSQILSGFAGGAWNGNGMTSPLAAANQGAHRTGIGYVEASALGVGSFLGQSVDDSTLILTNTFLGDANLDGQVNLADFNRLAVNFNGMGRTWSEGDVNYDGVVNLLDFNALASNFGQGAGAGDLPHASLGALVPEPTAGCVAGAALVIGFARQRRRGRSTQLTA